MSLGISILSPVDSNHHPKLTCPVPNTQWAPGQIWATTHKVAWGTAKGHRLHPCTWVTFWRNVKKKTKKTCSVSNSQPRFKVAHYTRFKDHLNCISRSLERTAACPVSVQGFKDQPGERAWSKGPCWPTGTRSDINRIVQRSLSAVTTAVHLSTSSLVGNYHPSTAGHHPLSAQGPSWHEVKRSFTRVTWKVSESCTVAEPVHCTVCFPNATCLWYSESVWPQLFKVNCLRQCLMCLFDRGTERDEPDHDSNLNNLAFH